MKARAEAGNNPDYWVKHIENNKKKNQRINLKLRERGHTVLSLWDTDIRKRLEWCVDRIRRALAPPRPPELDLATLTGAAPANAY